MASGSLLAGLLSTSWLNIEEWHPSCNGAWQYRTAGTFLCTVKAWVDAGLDGVYDWERLGITPDGQIALEELLGGVERNLLMPAWWRPIVPSLHFRQ